MQVVQRKLQQVIVAQVGIIDGSCMPAGKKRITAKTKYKKEKEMKELQIERNMGDRKTTITLTDDELENPV